MNKHVERVIGMLELIVGVLVLIYSDMMAGSDIITVVKVVCVILAKVAGILLVVGGAIRVVRNN